MFCRIQDSTAATLEVGKEGIYEEVRVPDGTLPPPTLPASNIAQDSPLHPHSHSSTQSIPQLPSSDPPPALPPKVGSQSGNETSPPFFLLRKALYYERVYVAASLTILLSIVMYTLYITITKITFFYLQEKALVPLDETWKWRGKGFFFTSTRPTSFFFSSSFCLVLLCAVVSPLMKFAFYKTLIECFTMLQYSIPIFNDFICTCQ